MAACTVYLPTARSIREFRKIYIQKLKTQAALLPQLIPMSSLSDGSEISEWEKIFIILKAIKNRHRQSPLTHVIERAASIANAIGLLLLHNVPPGTVRAVLTDQQGRAQSTLLHEVCEIYSVWPQLMSAAVMPEHAPLKAAQHASTLPALTWFAGSTGSTGLMQNVFRNALADGCHIVLPACVRDDDSSLKISEKIYAPLFHHVPALQKESAHVEFLGVDKPKPSITPLCFNAPHEEIKYIADLAMSMSKNGRRVSIVTSHPTYAKRISTLLKTAEIDCANTDLNTTNQHDIMCYLSAVLYAARQDCSLMDVFELMNSKIFYSHQAEDMAHLKMELKTFFSLNPHVDALEWLRDNVHLIEDQRKITVEKILEALWPLRKILLQRTPGLSNIFQQHKAAACHIISCPTEWADGGTQTFYQALAFSHQDDDFDYIPLWQAWKKHQDKSHNYSSELINVMGYLDARLLPHDVLILPGLDKNWATTSDRNGCLQFVAKKLGLHPTQYDYEQKLFDVWALASAAEEIVCTCSATQTHSHKTFAPVLYELFPHLAHHIRVKNVVKKNHAPVLYHPPFAAPPVAARPLDYTVSDIAQLMSDPYTHYVKKILRLKEDIDHDEDFDQADYGTWLHDVLRHWAEQTASGAMLSAEDITALGVKYLPKGSGAVQFAVWVPRLQVVAEHFVRMWQHFFLSNPKAEMTLRHTLNIADKKITLMGRADMIASSAEGRVHVIDYKSGDPPAATDVLKGFKPQLLLLDYLYYMNTSIKPAICFWSLGVKENDAKRNVEIKNADEVVDDVDANLKKILMHYVDASSAYAAVTRRNGASFYDDVLLSRRYLWDSDDKEF